MNNPTVLPNRLVHFDSYEDYFGKRIFNSYILFSYVGIALVLLNLIFDYKVHGANKIFFYVLCGRLTSAFFLAMSILSVIHPFFKNRRIEAVTIFGTLGFSTIASVYLLSGNPVHYVGYGWFYYLVATLILSPLITKKIYLLMESFQILFVLTVMGWIGRGPEEIASYAIVALPLALFAFVIVLFNRKNGIESYENAFENHVLISHDGHSGLLNRKAWYEESRSQWDSDKGVSFIMLDIDHFQQINDTYHECGDRVIESVTAILLKQTREYDIIGRLGEEEFGIILPQADLKEAKIIAERIRHTIETTPIYCNNQTIRITASIGVIENNENIDDFGTLVTLGDKHLNTAKEQGRNRVISS